MNEMTDAERAANKRKNMIKNVAIVFLVILLILTFFSQTIMNYSLPEVATQMVESGTVSPQIRGTGTIEADEPYEVSVKETRKIASVAVKVGDHVEKGAVIYYLEEMESPDLKDAQEKLDDLKQSYEMSLLRGDIDDEMIARVTSGYVPTFAEFRKKLKSATEKTEALKKQIEEIEDQINAIEEAGDYTSKRYKYDKATDEYTEAEVDYRLTEMDLIEDRYEIDIKELDEDIDELEKQIDEIEDELADAEEGTKKYDRLLAKYTAAERALASKKDEKESKEDEIQGFARERNYIALVRAQKTRDDSQIETQQEQVEMHNTLEITVLQQKKEALQKELDEAKEDRDDLLSNISREIELDASRKAVEDQEKVIEELEKNALGGEITAPISGTISSLAKTAGQSTAANEPVAVMQMDGKDMVMSFSVSNDQAKNLKVGDIAEPQNAWYYTNFKATLKSITADSTSPNTKKKLTFTVSCPDVQAGQSVSLTIGERSDRYDLTVPSSAVREDSNGKFVLIIKSKSSPLGNRYIASRVQVEVLASDDTTSAISGSLEGYEYVITTSTSPVEAGAQVRLANSQ